MESKQGKPIRSSGREVICNVIKACEQETKNKSFLCPLHAPIKRAAAYTGVSSSTIKVIKTEDKERQKSRPGQSLASPGKNRKRESIIDKIDDFDFQVIRREIFI